MKILGMMFFYIYIVQGKGAANLRRIKDTIPPKEGIFWYPSTLLLSRVKRVAGKVISLQANIRVSEYLHKNCSDIMIAAHHANAIAGVMALALLNSVLQWVQ